MVAIFFFSFLLGYPFQASHFRAHRVWNICEQRLIVHRNPDCNDFLLLLLTEAWTLYPVVLSRSRTTPDPSSNRRDTTGISIANRVPRDIAARILAYVPVIG